MASLTAAGLASAVMAAALSPGARSAAAAVSPRASATAAAPGDAGTAGQGAPQPSLTLSAGFSPERLGFATTLKIGFRVTYRPGQAPSPVTAVQLWLPAGLSIASSELGLATCAQRKLEQQGPAGCPANSLMGHGSATAEAAFGGSLFTEQARVTLFSGPLSHGHPQLLFIASGDSPLIADMVFSALVLPAPRRYGGIIDTGFPLVPSVPEGPDMALVSLQTTIGPAGVVYRERVKGRLVAFHPKGIVLPAHCPSGGFPFAARLVFGDGASAGDATAVPCPGRHRTGLRHPA